MKIPWLDNVIRNHGQDNARRGSRVSDSYEQDAGTFSERKKFGGWIIQDELSDISKCFLDTMRQ